MLPYITNKNGERYNTKVCTVHYIPTINIQTHTFSMKTGRTFRYIDLGIYEPIVSCYNA